MKTPDWRTLPLVAKPPPVMIVALEIKGPPITTDGQGETFTHMARGFLYMLCQPGNLLGTARRSRH